MTYAIMIMVWTLFMAVSVMLAGISFVDGKKVTAVVWIVCAVIQLANVILNMRLLELALQR